MIATDQWTSNGNGVRWIWGRIWMHYMVFWRSPLRTKTRRVPTTALRCCGVQVWMSLLHVAGTQACLRTPGGASTLLHGNLATPNSSKEDGPDSSKEDRLHLKRGSLDRPNCSTRSYLLNSGVSLTQNLEIALKCVYYLRYLFYNRK